MITDRWNLTSPAIQLSGGRAKQVGAKLATACMDRIVRVWDMSGPVPVIEAVLSRHGSAVRADATTEQHPHAKRDLKYLYACSSLCAPTF